jgi:hypothetical protein
MVLAALAHRMAVAAPRAVAAPVGLGITGEPMGPLGHWGLGARVVLVLRWVAAVGAVAVDTTVGVAPAVMATTTILLMVMVAAAAGRGSLFPRPLMFPVESGGARVMGK